MIKDSKVNDTPLPKPSDEEPHLLDLLSTLARNRTTVLGLGFVFAVLFLAATYIMPQTFTSMTSLLPPEKQGTSGLMSFLTGSGALDLMKGAENPATDMFIQECS
jgi:LPS O-antigen subunit length determinant protein (WzzB/FepE family)